MKNCKFVFAHNSTLAHSMTSSSLTPLNIGVAHSKWIDRIYLKKNTHKKTGVNH